MTVRERIISARLIEKARVQKNFSKRLEINYRYIVKPVCQHPFGEKESKFEKIRNE